MHFITLLWFFIQGLQDYQTVSNVISIEPSGLQLNSMCMDINITQDSVLESMESFLVVFSTSNPSIIINSGNATVIITDDDCKLLWLFQNSKIKYLKWQLCLLSQCYSCRGWIWPRNELCRRECWKLWSVCIPWWSNRTRCFSGNCCHSFKFTR